MWIPVYLTALHSSPVNPSAEVNTTSPVCWNILIHAQHSLQDGERKGRCVFRVWHAPLCPSWDLKFWLIVSCDVAEEINMHEITQLCDLLVQMNSWKWAIVSFKFGIQLQSDSILPTYLGQERKLRVIWTNATKTCRLGHEKHAWYNINLLDYTVICKKRDKPTVCCCRLTIFLRIQQQSQDSITKKESEKKKLFHLNRDRGEERGIRRITKRPTDWV